MFHEMHVTAAKAKQDRWKDRQMDDWQTYPYVALCFAGAIKTEAKLLNFNKAHLYRLFLSLMLLSTNIVTAQGDTSLLNHDEKNGVQFKDPMKHW